MNVVVAAVVYLFIAGLVMGPYVGEQTRCGNKPKVEDMLVMAIGLPMAFGVIATAGKLPKSEECKPKNP